MTLLRQDIADQAAAVGRALQETDAELERLVAAIRGRRSQRVLLVCRGTSLNAGIYARALFETFLGLPTAVAAPSLWTRYGATLPLDDTLVLAISQSGASPDLNQVLRTCREQGALTAAVLNTPGAPMASNAEYLVYCKAGPERAIPATASYTASLAVLAKLAALLSGDAAKLQALEGLQEAMRVAERTEDAAQELSERYHGAGGLVTIGRHFFAGTAQEASLKLREAARMLAIPAGSAEFLHGGHVILNPSVPLLATGAAGPSVAAALAALQTAREMGSPTIAVSDDPGLLQAADHPVPVVTGLPEWLAPIPLIVPVQLLALHLALRRGIDPDRPVHLNKVIRTI